MKTSNNLRPKRELTGVMPVGSSAVLDLSVNEIEFSARTANSILRIGGISTICDLCKWTKKGLLKQYGIGKKQVAELEAKLSELGACLTDDAPIKCQDPKYIKERIAATNHKIKELNTTLQNWRDKLKRSNGQKLSHGAKTDGSQNETKL